MTDQQHSEKDLYPLSKIAFDIYRRYLSDYSGKDLTYWKICGTAADQVQDLASARCMCCSSLPNSSSETQPTKYI